MVLGLTTFHCPILVVIRYVSNNAVLISNVTQLLPQLEIVKPGAFVQTQIFGFGIHVTVMGSVCSMQDTLKAEITFTLRAVRVGCSSLVLRT